MTLQEVKDHNELLLRVLAIAERDRYYEFNTTFCNSRDVVLASSNERPIDLISRDITSCAKQGAWLHDSVIMSFFQVIFNHYSKSDQSSGVRWIYLDSQLPMISEPQRMTELSRVNLHNVSVLFWPLNISQNHWVLLIGQVVSASEIVCTVLDSMRKASRVVQREVALVTQHFLQPAYGHVILKHGRAPQQTDGSSCGLYVVWFAYQLLFCSSQPLVGISDPVKVRSALTRCLLFMETDSIHALVESERRIHQLRSTPRAPRQRPPSSPSLEPNHSQPR